MSSSVSFYSIFWSKTMSWKYWSFSLFSKWYTIVSFGGLYFRSTYTGIEGIRLPLIDMAAKSTNCTIRDKN